MSHTSVIKAMKLTSESAIRAAVSRLAAQGIKIELLENDKPRSYYSAFGREQQGMGQAELVLRLAESRYDIGLYKQADGTYEPRTDFWQGDVEKVLGTTPTGAEYEDQARLGKFYQAYGLCATMEQANMQGLQYMEQVQQNGDVQLVVTGYN